MQAAPAGTLPIIKESAKAETKHTGAANADGNPPFFDRDLSGAAEELLWSQKIPSRKDALVRSMLNFPWSMDAAHATRLGKQALFR